MGLWRCLTLRPSELGDDPAGTLAHKLLAPEVLPELTEEDFGTPATLARQFADPALVSIPVRGALDRLAARAKQAGAYALPLDA